MQFWLHFYIFMKSAFKKKKIKCLTFIFLKSLILFLSVKTTEIFCMNFSSAKICVENDLFEGEKYVTRIECYYYYYLQHSSYNRVCIASSLLLVHNIRNKGNISSLSNATNSRNCLVVDTTTSHTYYYLHERQQANSTISRQQCFQKSNVKWYEIETSPYFFLLITKFEGSVAGFILCRVVDTSQK